MSLAAGHLSYSKAIENSGFFAESQVFSGKTRKNARILLKTAPSLSGIPLPTVALSLPACGGACQRAIKKQRSSKLDAAFLLLFGGEGGIRKLYIFSFNRLCKCLKYNMCIWVNWCEFVNS